MCEADSSLWPTICDFCPLKRWCEMSQRKRNFKGKGKILLDQPGKGLLWMGPEKSVAPQAAPWKSPEKVIRCTQMEGLRKSPETSLRHLPQLHRFMASECKLVPLE